MISVGRCIAAASAISLIAPALHAQSFAIDDNPSFPATGPPGFGFGAEDPFGLPLPPLFPPGLAPSPSLFALPCIDADILMVAPGPVPTLQMPTPNGFYDDSLSQQTYDLGSPIRIVFSVDRLSAGIPGSAVHNQWMLNQQPADMYRSTNLYHPPGMFSGLLGPPGFAGPLPSLIGGTSNNRLLFDDSNFGLLSGGAVIPPMQPAPPIAHGTHDNIDQFEVLLIDANGDGLNDDWEYFTIYPDEALMVGTDSADIYDVAPGTVGTVPIPYAVPPMMGLVPQADSIDGLVMYDNNIPGGPAWGGPGAEPHADYALFTLAPGSLSLAIFGLSPSDVLYTNFTGSFWLFAPGVPLGLVSVPGGEPGIGDSIDALEMTCAADISADGRVDIVDLLALLSAWGPNPGDPADTNVDTMVDVVDLLNVLSWWGKCS